MEEACVTAAELIDEGVAPIISVFAGATKGPVPRLEVAEACENVNEVVGEDVAPHNANALKTPALATVEDVCEATAEVVDVVASNDGVLALVTSSPLEVVEVENVC